MHIGCNQHYLLRDAKTLKFPPSNTSFFWVGRILYIHKLKLLNLSKNNFCGDNCIVFKTLSHNLVSASHGSNLELPPL